MLESARCRRRINRQIHLRKHSAEWGSQVHLDSWVKKYLLAGLFLRAVGVKGSIDFCLGMEVHGYYLEACDELTRYELEVDSCRAYVYGKGKEY